MLPPKLVRGIIQQIKNPGSTMAEMIGTEGSLVHLVEGGEEIVGVESDSVHLAQGEEEMMCID